MPVTKQSSEFEKLDKGDHTVKVLSARVSTFADESKALTLVVGPGGEVAGTAWWSVGSAHLTTLDLASVAGAFGVSYEKARESLIAKIKEVGDGFGHDEAGNWLVAMSKKADGTPAVFPVNVWHKKDKYAMAKPVLPDKRYLCRFLGFTPQGVYKYTDDGSPVMLPEAFNQTWKSEEGDSTGRYIYAVFVVVKGKYQHFPVWFKIRLNHEVGKNTWSFSENSGIAEFGDALGAWELIAQYEAAHPGEAMWEDERTALGFLAKVAHLRQAEITIKGGRTGWGNIVAPLDEEGALPGIFVEDAEDVKAKLSVNEHQDMVAEAIVLFADAAEMGAPIGEDGKLTEQGKRILGLVVKPLVEAKEIDVKSWPLQGKAEDVAKAGMLLAYLAGYDDLQLVLASQPAPDGKPKLVEVALEYLRGEGKNVDW